MDNRRRLIALVGVAIVATACSSDAPGDGRGLAAGGDPARPNVLVIVTDDQRVGTFQTMPRTRRWFRRGGTTYDNAYATTPLCCPSRASIFTGLYAHNHGVEQNDDAQNIPAKDTMQHHLQDAGYQTGIVGKYLGWGLKDPPYFDRWAIMKPEYYNARFNVDGEIVTVTEYSTGFIADKAVEYLRSFEEADEPWFLYVAPYPPHTPAPPDAEDRGAPVPPLQINPALIETDRSDKPDFVQDRDHGPSTVADFRARQLRSLMSVDDLVDDLFTELRRAGELDDTLAIYLSDNGYLHGEHGIMDKRYPYTRSIKIPLMVRWPGHVEAGSTLHDYVANIDVAPTVLDAAGIGPREMDGRSLFGGRVRDRMLTEYFRDVDSTFVPSWASTRTDDYQYTEYYGGGGAIVFREYYDLERDPWQLENLWATTGLAGLHPRKLHDDLATDRACASTSCP
ncbi:MAG: sulfatase [Actinomycetota bacterium]